MVYTNLKYYRLLLHAWIRSPDERNTYIKLSKYIMVHKWYKQVKLPMKWNFPLDVWKVELFIATFETAATPIDKVYLLLVCSSVNFLQQPTTRRYKNFILDYTDQHKPSFQIAKPASGHYPLLPKFWREFAIYQRAVKHSYRCAGNATGSALKQMKHKDIKLNRQRSGNNAKRFGK